MSKKQTRRSISVSGELYDRLRTHCEANNTTCSGVVEELLRSYLGMEERAPNLKKPPVERVVRPVAPPPPAPTRVDQIRESMARQEPPKAKEVTITTPVLEKNGNWEKKAAPVGKVTVCNTADEVKAAFKNGDDKKPGIPLEDLASKIFTF